MKELEFTYIGYFLAGIILADLYLTNWGNKFDKSRLWDTVTLIAFIVLSLLVKKRFDATYIAVLNAVIYPAIILVAYLGVFRGRLWNYAFGWRWAAVLGGMCYTVYMYHQFIIKLFSLYAIKVTINLPVLFIGFLCSFIAFVHYCLLSVRSHLCIRIGHCVYEKY